MDELRMFLNDRDRHRPLIRKLDALIDLEPPEVDCLAGLAQTEQSWSRGDALIETGQSYDEILIIEAGWAIAYKLLADGRRQVLRILLPGDMVGLHFAVADVAQASVEALTPLSTSRFPAQNLMGIYHNLPRIGAVIAWTAAREEAILSEHLISVGRRNAIERLAHLFLELLRRLQLIDLAGQRTMALPVTQAVLADAMGLSIVHVSRTMRQLRQAGLVRMTDQQLEIQDLAGLQDVAGFEEEFLMQDGLPDKLVSRLRY